MNTKNLLIATFAGGLISLILVNTPFVNLINLLLCAGFWIGPLVAVWLFRRMDGVVTMKQALIVGILAALWHGVLGLALSPLGLAGAGSLLNVARSFTSAQDLPALESTLTGIGGIMFNLLGLVFDVFFGFLGGLLGGAILGARRVTA